MATSLLPLLPQLLLVLFALAVLLYDLGNEDRPGLGSLAMLGPLAALLGLGIVAGHPGEYWGRMLKVDSFSLFFQLLTYAGTFLVILLSRDYVERQPIHRGEFYTLILLAGVGMSVMASSAELLMIYVGLELMSLSSYALVGMIKRQDQSIEAALKYYLMGAVTSAILLFGISLLFGITGTTYLPDIASALALTKDIQGNLLLIAAVVFVLAGFGFKVSLVPLHMWTPDVYQGAPTPITAFLAVGSKAAAFAGFIRLLATGLPAAVSLWQPLLALVAVVTMTYGNMTALAQTNMKRMMGYSSIAQAGYILTGLVVFTPDSLAATLYYLLAYLFMNIGVFACLIWVANQQESEEIAAFRGLGQRAPFYAVSLAIFFLSLVGIPPTGGFMGKFYLFFAAVQSHYVWLAVVMVINSVISLAYYYGVVRQMWLEPCLPAAPGAAAGGTSRWSMPAARASTSTPPAAASSTPEKAQSWPEPTKPASLALGVAVVISLLLVLLLGLYPQPFFEWVGKAALLG
ncbi:MAG: NADH-quinone oxidoreductase subunit N [Limnochordaceae bacterium]|nr:NADH-quinone oxidoreductase subunit N [Limnochordaceae bacterium]